MVALVLSYKWFYISYTEFWIHHFVESSLILVLKQSSTFIFCQVYIHTYYPHSTFIIPWSSLNFFDPENENFWKKFTYTQGKKTKEWEIKYVSSMCSTLWMIIRRKFNNGAFLTKKFNPQIYEDFINSLKGYRNLKPSWYFLKSTIW